MVVAADDGVMPQTREHAGRAARRSGSSRRGGVTKADLADPELRAGGGARSCCPGAEIGRRVSARTGDGPRRAGAALERGRRAAARPRAADGGAARACTSTARSRIRGIGTVVTGTLWSGAVGAGRRGDGAAERASTRACARVQVHDEPVERAEAGQRVALNLVGVAVRRAGARRRRLAPGAALAPTYLLDAALELDGGERPAGARRARARPPRHARGARRGSPSSGGRLLAAAPRAAARAAAGRPLVVRRIAPPDTLGGGVVLDPHAAQARPGARRARTPDARWSAGSPSPPAPEAAASPAPGPSRRRSSPGRAARSRRACARPGSSRRSRPSSAPPRPSCRRCGAPAEPSASAARCTPPGRRSPRPSAGSRSASATGEVTIAQLRDELGTSRKFAQALLEHFDGEKVTRRVGDEHVLRRGARPPLCRRRFEALVG